MRVEDVAGHHDVEVGQGEEREQGLGVQHRLAHDRPSGVAVSRLAFRTVVPQRPPADDDRDPGGERDPEDRGELGGLPHEQGDADRQPGHAGGDVEGAEGSPPALALEHAGLTAHERHGDGGHRDQQRDPQVVESQQPVDRGGEQHEHAAHDEGPPGADPEHGALDLGDVGGIGGDPAGRGGLQREREDADDQQQVHHRHESAVPTGAEQPGGDDRVAVRRDVHGPDRRRDEHAAAQRRGDAAGGWCLGGAAHATSVGAGCARGRYPGRSAKSS